MKTLRSTTLLQILCLLTGLSLFAQTKAPIVKFYAYVVETHAGNIQVDEQGNPLSSGVDHLHYLYAETTGKLLPEWQKVYTTTGSFAIQATAVDSAKVLVGKGKNAQKNIVIIPKRGSRLWKLELVPIKTKAPPNIEKLLKKNPVVVVTGFRNQQILHPVAKEVELEPIFYP